MNKQERCCLKRGDMIKVITGAEKGFIGNIKIILRKKSIVFINNLFIQSKIQSHLQRRKKVSSSLQEWRPINISNIMLWDEKGQIASKCGFKIFKREKVRYFKKSGNPIKLFLI